LWALPWPTFAQILTPAELRSSERLGIFLSAFDPPSQEDIETAENLVREHRLSYLILMPTSTAPPVEYAAISHRLRMLELATKNHAQLRLLTSFSVIEDERIHIGSALKQSAEARVPQTLIFSRDTGHQDFLGNADNLVFVPIRDAPKFDARAFLRDYPELFFGDPNAFIAIRRPPFADEVLHYIHERGLYFLENGPPTQLRRTEKTPARMKEWAYYGLRRLALLYVVQSFRGKQPTPEKSDVPHRFTFQNHTFYVTGYLGSGFQSDAYLVSVEGARYVLKVPRGSSEEHRYYSQKTTMTHRWLVYQKMPNIPALIDYDPEGLWSLSEYIDGESLSERMRNGDPLSESEMDSYREIFEYAMALYRRSGMRLDLTAPNIILRGGRAFLVDLGTTLEPWFPTVGFEEWIGQQRRRCRQAELIRRRNEAVLACAKRLLLPMGKVLRPYWEPNLTTRWVAPSVPLPDSVGSSHGW